MRFYIVGYTVWSPRKEYDNHEPSTSTPVRVNLSREFLQPLTNPMRTLIVVSGVHGYNIELVFK